MLRPPLVAGYFPQRMEVQHVETYEKARFPLDRLVEVRPVRAEQEDRPFTTVGPVHHLHHGVAACVAVEPAARGLPKDWPAGHLWSADWGDVTCRACLMNAPGAL